MMNTFILPVAKEISAAKAGPDASLTRRTAEAGTGAVRKDFYALLKQEPVENLRGGRQDESRPVERTDRTERNEKTGRVDERKAERPSAEDRNDRPEKIENRESRIDSDRPSLKKDAASAADRQAEKASKAGKPGANGIAPNQADHAKKSLVKDILAFLERHGEKAAELLKGSGKTMSSKDIEKALLEMSDKDLKDLKKFFEAAKAAGAHHPVFRQFVAFLNDKARSQGVPEARSGKQSDSAFRVEYGEHGRKVFVNKDRIQVVDTRSSQKDHLRQSDAGSQVKPGQAEQPLKKEAVPSMKFDQMLMRESQVQKEILVASRQAAAHDLRTVNQAFNDLVKWSKLMLDDKKSVMQIDLKPDHLGRIMLKIEMVDNKLSAQIFAQNQGTGDMFRQNMADLQDAFKQAGLNVERLDVNVASNSGGGAGEEDRSFRERFGEAPMENLNGRPGAPAVSDYAGLLNYGPEAEARTVNYIV